MKQKKPVPKTFAFSWVQKTKDSFLASIFKNKLHEYAEVYIRMHPLVLLMHLYLSLQVFKGQGLKSGFGRNVAFFQSNVPVSNHMR